MKIGPKVIGSSSILYTMDASSTRSIPSSIETNLLDYSTWTAGNTSASGFSRNGATTDNILEYGLGPFGENTVLWASRNNDATSNADGGWNGSQKSIDPNYMYRISVWVYREVNGNGSFYIGTRGYTSGSNTGVLTRSSNGRSTNPYFWSGGLSSSDGWQLFVGHVWPANSGTGSNHPDSGRYKVGTGKFANISNDWVMDPTTTHIIHRSYLYYSTDSSTVQKWAYPRIDKIDGTEPSIDDLLGGGLRKVKNLKSKGHESFLSNKLRSKSATNVRGLGIKSLDFDGVDDHISIQQSIPGNFTISCWFKHGPNQGWGGSYEQHLVASDDNWQQGRYRLYLTGSSSIHFYEYDQGVTGTAIHDDGEWHHFVATYQGGLLSLYFDGVLINSASRSISITTTNMAIGRLYVGSNDIRYFQGSIGKVDVYDRGLSGTEVLEKYKTNRNRFRS